MYHIHGSQTESMWFGAEESPHTCKSEYKNSVISGMSSNHLTPKGEPIYYDAPDWEQRLERKDRNLPIGWMGILGVEPRVSHNRDLDLYIYI